MSLMAGDRFLRNYWISVKDARLFGEAWLRHRGATGEIEVQWLRADKICKLKHLSVFVLIGSRMSYMT